MAASVRPARLGEMSTGSQNKLLISGSSLFQLESISRVLARINVLPGTHRSLRPDSDPAERGLTSSGAEIRGPRNHLVLPLEHQK